MAWKTTGAIIFMFLVIPSAEASLFDPRLCYILDGFLMFYGVMITALFVREKCFRPKSVQGPDNIYQDLQRTSEDKYEGIRRGHGDVEKGSRGRRQEDDGLYTRLAKPSEDTYREIATKDRRRNKDDVYQGLNTGTKDTYDRLHAQPRHQTSR